MSDWHAEVVRITEVRKHDNADRLEVAMVYGTTPVIIQKGQYKAGDLVSYIPIDSVLPDRAEFSFLTDGDRRRLKAKRLRGVFSMGLLVDAPAGLKEGASVVDHFGIKRFVPGGATGAGPKSRPKPKTFLAWVYAYLVMLYRGIVYRKWPERSDMIAGPRIAFPKFTDIESYRRHPNVLEDGELVVCTEKVHGTNARYMFDGSKLWVGTRNTVRRTDGPSVWAEVARRLDLAGKLKKAPKVAFYGEIFGKDQNGSGIQDLTYGHTEPRFVLFDAYDCDSGNWYDASDLPTLAELVGLELAPKLYEGPWSKDLLKMAEGKTTIGGGHVREGFVVRPLRERFHGHLPHTRVLLKVVGEGYLTRKTVDAEVADVEFAEAA